MSSTVIVPNSQRNAKEIRSLLNDNCFNVYWQVPTFATKHRVINVRNRKGMLELCVLRNQGTEWQSVAAQDILSFQ